MLADPRLGLSDEAVRRIAEVAVPDGCAFINELAPFPLTAEIVDGQIRLRAATGDEVTELLTTGDGTSADGISWPGDPATQTGREIEWQARHDEPPSFEPAAPVSKVRRPPCPSANIAARCSVVNFVSLRPIAALSCPADSAPAFVARGFLGQPAELVFDPDLRGVADPDAVIEQADDQGDMLAFELDAARLQQPDYPLDVGRAAGDPDPDQAARGKQAQLLVVEDGSRVELGGQMAGGELIGLLEAVVVAECGVRDLVDDALMFPAERLRLFPP